MLIKKFFNYLLIVIAAFPIIGLRSVIIVIAFWCLLGIIIFFKDKLYLTFFNNWKSLLFLSSYYLMLLISFVFFTTNYSIAIKTLETKASFIIFPVFFYSCREILNQKTFFKSLLSFAISNTLLVLYIWGIILSKGIFNFFSQDTYYYPLFRKTFSDLSGIHLPYLGLLFGFSILIYLHVLKTKKTMPFLKFLSVFSIFMLMISMFVFSARAAIFSTIMSTLFYVFLTIKKKNKVLLYLSSLIVLTILLSLLPPTKRRIDSLTKIELVLPHSGQKSHQVNFRYGIYYCVYNTLKDHWFLGTGLGSMQTELNNCYGGFSYKNYDDFETKQYNCHNQFFNDWLTHGIFGLFLLLFYLGYVFINGNVFYKSFIIIFTTALLTESLFEREVGVIHFAFFNTLFYTFAFLKKAGNKI